MIINRIYEELIYMSDHFLHGIDTEQEKQLRVNLVRDVRPGSVKLANFFKSAGMLYIPLTSIFIMAWFPVTIYYLVFINYLLFKSNLKSQKPLPFKKPKSSLVIIERGKKGKHKYADGISFYGNDKKTGEQIWFNDSDVKTHTLVFGTTGAGKTETLISLCVNSLIGSSGFIYVDGKGDNSLFMKIFSIVRRFGREDDLLLINYMSGSVDPLKKTTEKLSNTLNPFSSGNSDSLAELVISLLPDGGGDGMWKGRAAIFMMALLRVLVALRDANKILLDVETIRSYFLLNKLEELLARDDIANEHKAGLRDYVINLPGYKPPTSEQPNPEQEQDTLQQHGFITMQYTESFGLLADTYGKLMKTQLAECDFYDIIVNRRILVVLLPALEKSSQNLSNLGKIIVASVKGMMASSLGSQVEGDKADVIDRKPTAGGAPYMTVFDEFGYYATKGCAVMPAQARSLGFAMVFAGQDYQAFKKASPEDAASIVANCAVKICMKLEDPTETFDIFLKAAGEGSLTTNQGYQLNTGDVFTGYREPGNVSVSKSSRINVRDLKAQDAGEAHVLFQDTLVRAKMYYSNPTSVKSLRLNAFLKVMPPSFEEVERYKSGFKNIGKTYEQCISGPERQKIIQKFMSNNGFAAEIKSILDAIEHLGNVESSTDTAFFALASYVEHVEYIDTKLERELEASSEETPVPQTKQVMSERKELNFERKKAFDEAQKEEPLINLVSSSVDKLEKDNKNKKGPIDKIRSMLTRQRSNLEQADAPQGSLFKKINVDIPELKHSIETIEHELNHKMASKNILKDEDALLRNEYSKLVAEQTVSSIQQGLSYPMNRIKDKKDDDNLQKLMDQILIDD